MTEQMECESEHKRFWAKMLECGSNPSTKNSLLCLPVNVRHFVFLCLQGNIILQHVNHNCGLICVHANRLHPRTPPGWHAAFLSYDYLEYHSIRAII